MAFAAGPAFANSPHFKKGGSRCARSPARRAFRSPVRAPSPGLGMEDLSVHLSVSGFALYQCQNGGGNTAPGQNKVLEGPATSDTAFPASAIKNGNLTFTTNPATLTAAATVSAATAGCPNNNWTGVNPVLTLTSITLDIFQPVMTVMTEIFHCTASDRNGLTSPVTLTC